MTRLFFVAGESSGDIHGANLIRALRKQDPSIACEGLGGHHMAEAGMTLRYDLAGDAIMGFSEVVKAYTGIRRLAVDTLAHLKQSPPDALVLIDYPGFNIHLGKKAKALGIPIIYYISPQVWAWKKKRIHTIAKMVEKMLVIFPFERKLYQDIGVDCTYVGHPLLDHIRSIKTSNRYADDLVIGILPGSRQQEIRRLMPVLIETARGLLDTYPEARFVTPCVNASREAQIRAMAGDFPLEIVIDGTYDLLSSARFCLVASGTATLETALFGVPMLILYKVSAINYWIARSVVKIKHIGIVNILAERGIVPEFIQHEATVERVLPASLELIADTPQRARMLDELAGVHALLGDSAASVCAASQVLEVCQGGSHG